MHYMYMYVRMCIYNKAGPFIHRLTLTVLLSCSPFLLGCRVCPKQSLMDLSVSLLLDDSRRNVYAYLHRGILYTEIKRLVTPYNQYTIFLTCYTSTLE